MIAYAPSDVRTISLGAGCGEQHSAPEGEQLVVDCPQCAPLLIAGGASTPGWASSPGDVALTCDERRQLESDKAAAEQAQALAMRTFGAQLASLTKLGQLPATQPTPGGIVPRVEDLTAEELDAFAAAIAAARGKRTEALPPTPKRGPKRGPKPSQP